MGSSFFGIEVRRCPDGAIRTLMPDGAVFTLESECSRITLSRKFLFRDPEVLYECKDSGSEKGYMELLDMLSAYSAEHLAMLLVGVLNPARYNIVKA